VGEKRTPSRNDAAHKLLEARRISQGVRRLTGGIEIHPGATIGKRFFIDHGAGVVIGETATIGDDVFLYHDVTLGAFGGERAADGRRHPKIGNNVIISTGANILGPADIGNGVRVGTNALLSGKVTIGDDSRLSDAVLLKGNVTLGQGVKVRAGARIIGNVTIGDGAVIDPDITVTRDIPAGAHVTGLMPSWLAAFGTPEATKVAGMPVYGTTKKDGTGIPGMVFGTVHQVNAIAINGLRDVMREFLNIANPAPQTR
jgi:serine acetyltransferase